MSNCWRDLRDRVHAQILEGGKRRQLWQEEGGYKELLSMKAGTQLCLKTSL